MGPKSKQDFERVVSFVERRKLFETLLAEQIEIVCKAEAQEELMALKVKQVAELNTKEVELTFKTSYQGPDQAVRQNILGQFSIGESRYFFKFEAQPSPKELKVNLDFDIFLLQRRKTFRIQLPENLRLRVEVTAIEGKPLIEPAQALDFSAGGLKLDFFNKSIVLEKGQKVQLLLFFPSRRVVPLTGIVKHVQVEQGSGFRLFGVEFVAVSETDRNRLVGLGLDLQRRVFKV